MPPSTFPQMPRLRILSIAGLLVLGACAGDDESPAAEAVVPSTTTAPIAPTTTDAPQELRSELADATEEWSAEIDLVVQGFDGGDLDTTVGWSGDPQSIAESDPFGEFAACSGWRARLGAYSVLVSGGAEVAAVSVWSADRVQAAGIYDAQVRVERPGSPPVEASGTMTLLDGLQRGEFVAFGPSGGRVEGTFACTGAPSPVPLGMGDAGTAEVFALLSDGEAERFLGLAADGSVDAECPGGPGAVIVDVEGDPTVGGITAFELAGDGPVTGRLRAGGATYELDDVTVTLDDGGTSGVFAAVSPEGVSVDGAFRCT